MILLSSILHAIHRSKDKSLIFYSASLVSCATNHSMVSHLRSMLKIKSIALKIFTKDSRLGAQYVINQSCPNQIMRKRLGLWHYIAVFTSNATNVRIVDFGLRQKQMGKDVIPSTIMYFANNVTHKESNF